MATLNIFTRDTRKDLQQFANEISPATDPLTMSQFYNRFQNKIIETLNKYFVHIGTSKPFIIRSYWNELMNSTIEHISIPTFINEICKTVEANIRVPKKKGKDTSELEKFNIGSLWLDSDDHTFYNQITFKPGTTIKGPFYNTWAGFGIKYDSKKDVIEATEKCEMLLKHIKKRWCENDEFLYNWTMSWMASILQKPGHKWKSCIVLRGTQGCGKGVVVEKLAKIIGRNYYMHAARQNDVLGRFNSCLEEKLLVFCDEIVWGGQKQMEGFLKIMISEDEIPIEKKGVDIRYVNNYARLIMASNESWCCPCGQNSRRYLVLEVNDDLLKPENEEELNDIIDTDPEDFATVLYNWDITGFNGNKVPKTEGLKIQQSLSLPKWAQWLHKILLAGEIDMDGDKYILDEPNKMPSSIFYELYTRENRAYPFPSNVLLKNVYKATGTCSIRQYENGRRIRLIKWNSIDEMRKTFEEQYHAGFETDDDETPEDTIKDRISSELIKLQSLIFQIPESERSKYYRLMDALQDLDHKSEDREEDRKIDDVINSFETDRLSKDESNELPGTIEDTEDTQRTDNLSETGELDTILMALNE